MQYQNQITTAFLEHYGIKGQKWGVRRKNRGGSRSSGKTSYKKSAKRLSEKELNRRIKRMELEQRYTALSSPKKTAGKSYASSIISGTGKTAAAAATGFLIQKALKAKFG